MSACQLDCTEGTIACTDTALVFSSDTSTTTITFGHLYAVQQPTPTLLHLHHLDPTTSIPTTTQLHIDDATPLLRDIHQHLPPPPKKVHIYCNPISGQQQSTSILQTIVRPMLIQAGVRFDTTMTECKGHAERLAQADAARAGIMIVALGGDGLVHEIINGYAAALVFPIYLCVVPCGSGNALATSMGIKSPGEAIQRLLAGKTRAIDLMHVTIPATIDNSEQTITRLAAVVVSWGLHTAIVAGGDRWRGWFGASRFKVVAAALFAALPYYDGQVSLYECKRFDPLGNDYGDIVPVQTLTGPFQYFVSGKQEQFEPGFHILPYSQCDDGWIDVVTVRGGNITRSHIWDMHAKARTGEHIIKGLAEAYKCKRMQLKCGKAGGDGETVCVDGELYSVKSTSMIVSEIAQDKQGWVHIFN
jgi:diacylglycerol kinase family enzyme